MPFSLLVGRKIKLKQGMHLRGAVGAVISTKRVFLLQEKRPTKKTHKRRVSLKNS
jgi:hypothetical protein